MLSCLHMNTPQALEKKNSDPNAKEFRNLIRTVAPYFLFLLVVIVASDTAGKLSETPEGLVSHNKRIVGGDDILLTSPHPASYVFSAEISFFWLLVLAV